jgi:hypothetical protein
MFFFLTLYGISLSGFSYWSFWIPAGQNCYYIYNNNFFEQLFFFAFLQPAYTFFVFSSLREMRSDQINKNLIIIHIFINSIRFTPSSVKKKKSIIFFLFRSIFAFKVFFFFDFAHNRLSVQFSAKVSFHCRPSPSLFHIKHLVPIRVSLSFYWDPGGLKSLAFWDGVCFFLLFFFFFNFKKKKLIQKILTPRWAWSRSPPSRPTPTPPECRRILASQDSWVVVVFCFRAQQFFLFLIFSKLKKMQK